MKHVRWISSLDDFLAAGFHRREYFEHQVMVLNKRYPDAHLIYERRNFAPSELQTCEFRQINLYACDIDEYDEKVFFDPGLNWHRQQLGIKGLIGAAGIMVSSQACAFVSLLQSDLLQQLYRFPEYKQLYKTRFENRFHGWNLLLINSVMFFARMWGIKSVYFPTSDTIVRKLNSDPNPDLFKRIYDSISRLYEVTKSEMKGCDYWEVKVADCGNNIAGLKKEECNVSEKPTICILHDIEEAVDTDISPQQCRQSFEEMLRVERDVEVRATYNVLGSIYEGKRTAVAQGGHAIGFHSYDHSTSNDQLQKVRSVDLQVKGYRPPRSVHTKEINAYNLVLWNFEWLASSRYVLGLDEPRLIHGLVNIPITLDDYPLFIGEQTEEQWFSVINDWLDRHEFLALSLHDCYAGKWLVRYRELLELLAQFGEFKTCDQLADEYFLRSSCDELVLPNVARSAVVT